MNTIKLLFLDVDGTLTDGGIYYDSRGNETKKFNVKDGAAFALAHAAGLKLIIVTGRESECVRRRMEELHADLLVQNVKDKSAWVRRYLAQNAIDGGEVGYIGDDLNDLNAMRQCGFVACPSGACEMVRSIADYISPYTGGNGAVRDCIEYILKQQGMLEKAAEIAYLQNAPDN